MNENINNAPDNSAEQNNNTTPNPYVQQNAGTPPFPPSPYPAFNPETEEQKVERARLFTQLFIPTIVYALLFTFCIYDNYSGITMPLLSLATVIYSFYCIKTYKIQLKSGSCLYGAMIILLGISSFTTGNGWIISLNLLGIALMLLCMLLHNFYDDNNWNLAKYIGAIFASIFGALSEFCSPFKDLSNYEKHKPSKSKGLYVAIGIGISIPLLIVIVSLLSCADAVFACIIGSFFVNINFSNIIGVTFTFAFAFMAAYCGIRYLGKHQLDDAIKENQRYDAIIAITVLSLVSVVYLFFSVIQIVYLFIGNMELPKGYPTYASYAHEGFYQLLFVCILNVIIVLFTMSYFNNNKFVKILLTVISLCTYIMIASSALRMWLYVKMYSLTVLRVFVFWTLMVLAILLAGILIQIYKDDFHLFRYGLVVVCACYLVLSFSHMDYWIAKFNLGYVAVNDGDVDYDYLETLSSDAAPAIIGESGEWVNWYGDRQCYYKYDGIRGFNVSHYIAYKTFSSENE